MEDVHSLHSLWQELRTFTPADFHWPTFLITMLLLTAFYLINLLISHLVSRTLSRPPADPAPLSPSHLLDFFLLVGRLKTTPRTGWVNHSVPHPESISDHMYRLSIMSYVFSPPLSLPPSSSSSPSPSSFLRAVFMAVVHDLAESRGGGHHTAAHLRA